MPDIYPCRVIITNNKNLARYFNEDPENALMASHCLTVEEAICLFEEKRKIETIILINGKGEELICQLADQLEWDKGNMPDVVRIDVPDNNEVAAKDIKKRVCQSSLLFLWAG